jgi:hypothetical protein
MPSRPGAELVADAAITGRSGSSGSCTMSNVTCDITVSLDG